MKSVLKKFIRNILLASMMVATSVITPIQAVAASTATPKVTFTFDDGRASTFQNAAPILAQHGLSGTAYVITDCVGMTQTPNKCHASNDTSYMTWAQIKKLQNNYGWEIGSHTKTHPYLASFNAADKQPNRLPDEQVVKELKASKADLQAQGIHATSFASPYGDYNPSVLQEVAKYYTSHRGFADTNNNVWPYNDLLINNMPVQATVTVADVKAKVDYAIAHNTWLVLTFHDIVPQASDKVNKYQWGTKQLASIASYVKAKRDARLISTVNASGGLATGSSNLLPGADFTSGIANGWRTDAPSIFSADGANNGSYPEPQKSLRIGGNSMQRDAHLFSPMVSVSSNNTYLIKSYLNVTSIVRGEVGYYIDEYDSAGNWISGQIKSRETNRYVEDINFGYTPTSPAVAQASLQIYSTANSQATGYFDSVRWYVASNSTPQSQTNMMPDGAFDHPWSSGWSTDRSAAVVLDKSSHGSPSNPANSIAASAKSGQAHLFSPKISVDATKSYYLQNYLNITSTSSGEVGYYIDEYDASGNWVSGQYLATRHNKGIHNVALNYKPSSSKVKKASLQFIFVAGSQLNCYVDDVRWYAL